MKTFTKQLKIKDGAFTKKGKAAKKALKLARTDLSTYVSQVNTAVVLSDPQANLLDLNSGIQKSLGKAFKGNSDTFSSAKSKALKSISALLAVL